MGCDQHHDGEDQRCSRDGTTCTTHLPPQTWYSQLAVGILSRALEQVPHHNKPLPSAFCVKLQFGPHLQDARNSSGPCCFIPLILPSQLQPHSRSFQLFILKPKIPEAPSFTLELTRNPNSPSFQSALQDPHQGFQTQQGPSKAFSTQSCSIIQKQQ